MTLAVAFCLELINGCSKKSFRRCVYGAPRREIEWNNDSQFQPLGRDVGTVIMQLARESKQEFERSIRGTHYRVHTDPRFSNILQYPRVRDVPMHGFHVAITFPTHLVNRIHDRAKDKILYAIENEAHMPATNADSQSATARPTII